MNTKKEIIAITLDPQTKDKLDNFGLGHGLSRSATIRMIVNDYFIKQRGKT